jgi:hypothetical protein
MLLFAKLAIFLNSSPSFAIPASIHASVCCFFFSSFFVDAQMEQAKGIEQ